MRPSEQFNLHPADHQPSDLKTTSFDVICIGSGWAGRVLAARMVQAGFTAVIVESELVGGDCPFWACVPSKALLRPPEVLQTAKDMGGAAEKVTGDGSIDVAAAFARRDKITMNKDDNVALVPMVESTGAVLVRGTGKLVGVKKVQVSPIKGEPIQLDSRLAVVLCNGSEPVIPKEIKQADPWTPRDATSAGVAPKHLIIIGSGAVGCEMATAYRKYGSQVTLISSSAEIISSVDSTAGKIVRESLEASGVVFHLGMRVKSAERSSSSEVTVHLSNGNSVSGSEVLVAMGRQANLHGLGLDSVGVADTGRFLTVDESLCVATGDERWLYAAGDINGRAPLTHTSKYHAAIAANAILDQAKGIKSEQGEWTSSSATADKQAVPQVVFTDPIVASVGLTRKVADAKGVKYRAVNAPLTSPGYNIHSDKPSASWAQWLLDPEDRLLGATFVGTDAAELLHASTVAIVGGVKLQRLMHAIPSFPTLSWVYYNLMDAAGV